MRENLRMVFKENRKTYFLSNLGLRNFHVLEMHRFMSLESLHGIYITSCTTHIICTSSIFVFIFTKLMHFTIIYFENEIESRQLHRDSDIIIIHLFVNTSFFNITACIAT